MCGADKDKRGARLRLYDMLSAIDDIEAYIQDQNWESFESNKMVQDAVTRKIEILGEAARNIPESIASGAPDVPWHEIRGMRNIIAHDYFYVDAEIVWRVACDRLPDLKVCLEALYIQISKREGTP